MNSIVVEVHDAKYLIRYQVLKSVVNRKHTTKEGKVTNRLEIHPTSLVVYLYKIELNTVPFIQTKKGIDIALHNNILSYLGRGLSKCSDKDKFDKKLGIRVAISNIETLSPLEHNSITNTIKNTKL